MSFIDKYYEKFNNSVDEHNLTISRLEFAKLLGVFSKHEQQLNRYKQVVKEIKEIAAKRNYLDYNECLDDILQKISECEGNND